MREKPVNSFSSAADALRAPASYFSSPEFSRLRWTTAGEQRDERMRLFCRKLLMRLDGMDMPFYPAVGLMDLMTARHRFVTGLDPWTPSESPFLDGTGLEIRHCRNDADMPPQQRIIIAEIAFDVANLAQIPVMWGGFAATPRPLMWRVYDGCEVDDWRVDARTYGVRRRGKLDYAWT